MTGWAWHDWLSLHSWEKITSWAHRAVLAHSKSGARMKTACTKILLLCAVFIFVLWPLLLQTEDWSSDVTGGQTLVSSWLPAVCWMPCLAPSWSPALSKATFERRALTAGAQRAAPLPSCTTPSYVGHVVLISEALMWAGNLVLTLFFPHTLQQLFKDSMRSVLWTWCGGKWSCWEFKLSFSLVCVNCVNLWTELIHKLISYSCQAIPSNSHWNKQ